MVARGDLGLEMPLERVPRAQKDITRARAAPRHPGHRRHAGARVDDRRSRGRRAPKSATPPTRSTTASTRSCWRAKRRPARFRRARCRRSTRSSATRRRAPRVDAARSACADRRARRSRAGAVRGGGHAGRPRRRAGDRRRHARRQHGAAAVGAASARADFRGDRTRRDGAAAGALLGRGAGLHGHRREPSTLSGTRDRRGSSSRAGSCAAGAAVVLVSINPDLTRPDANYLKIQRL